MIKLNRFYNKAGENGGSGGGAGDEKDIATIVAEAVAAALPKALNGAITSHLRRLEAKIDERIKPLEAKSTPAEGEEGEETAEGGAPAATPKGKGSPEVQALQQQLASVQKQLDKQKKETEAEKAIREKAVAEGRVREERGALQDALTAAGVKGKMLGPAVAFLYGEQKRIKRVADGDKERLVWADGDDELDIAEGVKAWTKSEDGLGFMPARDVGGSGGTGSSRGGGGGGGPQGMSDTSFIDALVGNTPSR
jgi:hypothetical protein